MLRTKWDAIASSFDCPRTGQHTKHLLMFLIANVLVAPEVLAQSRVEVPNRPACDQCRIVLARERTLGTREGPGIIESNVSLTVRDSSGQFYHVSATGAAAVKVFDRQGRYVTSVGRAGEGPGEYRHISRILMGPDHRLHVLDQRTFRWTVLSPASLNVHRAATIPGMLLLNATILGDGRIVVASPVRTAQRAGLPLHLIDQQGTIAHSFGSESGFFRADAPNAGRRIVASARDGSVWSALLNDYLIERWAVDGTFRGALHREVAWLSEEASPSDPDPQYPAPQVRALRETSEGLWVMISVPDPDWRKEVVGSDAHSWRIDDLNGYYDTVIELMSASDGTVVATTRTPMAFVNFVDDSAIAATVLEEDGTPFVEVWSFDLVRP